MKRRTMYSIVALILVLSIIMTGCVGKEVHNPLEVNNPLKENEQNESEKREIDIEINQGLINIEVPYEPRTIEALVEPYKTNENMTNVLNSEKFGSFSKEQLELLAKNNFVVNPTKEEQLFYIYENNEYLEIPSFITTDSVLQVYHIFYDYTLRTLESDKLLALVEEMTNSMLNNSIKLYNDLTNKELKEIQLKNIAYFATAQIALEKNLPNNIPVVSKEMAEAEWNLIKNSSGFSQSNIFPYKLDYSQYTIRGHYTRSKDLERYFRAMMWYGQAPFPLYFEEADKGIEQRNIEQTLQALLITCSLYSDEESYTKWENIYEPTNFFVGSSDDLNIYQYGEVLTKVYGKHFDINELNNKKKLEKFYKEADKLPEPQIKAKYTSESTPTGKQFRLMGQRYVIDAEIMQELVEPFARPIASGLDVMGVLGSERAKVIQLTKEENQQWKDYPVIFQNLKEKFNRLSDKSWRANMYQGWLWVLKGFLEPFGEGYPSFMTNEAWNDKDLNTALGSWSELKHDTILYGKQIGAECGDGYEENIPKGYVEPNIEVYEKLLWLTKFSRKNLSARGLTVESIHMKMEKFEDILEFLINCSIKELRNESLTIEEYERINIFGGILEDLTASFAGDYMRWFEITSETDKNMAVIADFQTLAPNKYSDGGYVEAGVGPAYEIYVVVPIDGNLYLTRGAIFSYHEFISGERLTDEKWQEMIKENNQPPMPQWTNSFIREGKGEIPYPNGSE
ncbi:DUF3160 domain-containing protein [Tissierella pigra]|uniref:DUF3160 domain-containing protein n=1 Tax=Tissierella pigra TaxID=2607614 RepID=A0A6N7XND1_9FIRM|nr:DUF3160 domain-containing protein [Tissierella pigra]MBU5427728.1 DUF3160 domain-containing protein [Tissierella pigra]MSU03016.1 DUF3160 domain-containing protein [Tissierella pigra]